MEEVRHSSLMVTHMSLRMDKDYSRSQSCFIFSLNGGDVIVYKVHTNNDNFADSLTKPLLLPNYKRHTSFMGIRHEGG